MCKLCAIALGGALPISVLVKNVSSHEVRSSSQNLSQWGVLSPKQDRVETQSQDEIASRLSARKSG
jgi:hypothetical protein